MRDDRRQFLGTEYSERTGGDHGTVIETAGDVFNVVNKNGVIYFIDGQTGGFAKLENYSQLNFLRTN